MLKDYMKYELLIEKEVYHLPCFAHVLNLSVQSGITMIKDTIKNLRDLGSALKHSTKQKQLLEETSAALKQKYAKMKRDNNIRWNSTYDMINRALSLKKVIKTLSNYDENNIFKDNKISDKDCNNL